mmetsp:Transcript_11994/g.14914  ORF Transcript_11994/g.14914 Transcript_11994/m.14914 type:complete len:230 (+) Transcript_11994:88-777(+)
MFQLWGFDLPAWSASLSRPNLGLNFNFGTKGEIDILRKHVAKRKEYWDRLLSSDSAWASARDNKRQNSLIKELCYLGIPSNVRGKAWPALLGNKLRITADLFQLLSHQNENDVGDKDGNFVHCEIIAKDVKIEEEFSKLYEVEKKELTTSESEKTILEDNSAEDNPTSKSTAKKIFCTESEKTIPDYGCMEDKSTSKSTAQKIICNKDSYLEHIRQDIPRTFPHLGFFS